MLAGEFTGREARQLAVGLHELDEVDDALGVPPDLAELALQQCPVLEELWRVETSQDIDVVLGQLERSHLESERARRVRQKEAKVDVCSAAVSLGSYGQTE